MIDLIVYEAKAMTGRSGHELLAESHYTRGFLEAYGIQVLDPVLVENVQPSTEPLHNTLEDLKGYWARDKEMIRKAHVLLDLSGPAKSEGVAHEIGYARFCLWKPVVRIYPTLGPSVAWFEDDAIVSNLKEAAEIMVARWGTVEKRRVWREYMLGRCWDKWMEYQQGEWK